MRILRPVIRDLVGQVLHGIGLTRLGRRGTDVLTIVTFHRVLPHARLRDYPFPELAVTPEELGWFLGLFRRHFRCGPLGEIMDVWRRGRASAPPLAITFDDGQVDNYVHARPVLERLGLCATFYVVSDAATQGKALWHDQVGAQLEWLQDHHQSALQPLFERIGLPPNPSSSLARTCVGRLKEIPDGLRRQWIDELQAEAGDVERPAWDGLMDWDQIRAMSQGGHEIGSHSRTHPILTQCDSETLIDEIVGSKKDIEDHVDREIISFCYPNGDHNEQVRAAVAAAGYRTAVTTQWGLNDTDRDPLVLRRCDVQSSTARSFRGTLSAARVAWRLSGYHPGLH